MITLNDYRNLFKPEDENDNEVFADDITEGKFTLPFVHAIKILKNQEVANIFKSRPKDLETRRKCVNILKEIGTQDYCKKVLNDILKLIKTEMKNLDENPILDFVLEAESDFNDW
jgi:geranylgeranyl pyrophosphate synthase